MDLCYSKGYLMVYGPILDYIQVSYERLRDYKVNLSYSKWEVSVITKTIFPIVVSIYTILSTMGSLISLYVEMRGCVIPK